MLLKFGLLELHALFQEYFICNITVNHRMKLKFFKRLECWQKSILLGNEFYGHKHGKKFCTRVLQV